MDWQGIQTTAKDLRMIVRLNGWMRLFVVLTLFWFVGVGAAYYLTATADAPPDGSPFFEKVLPKPEDPKPATQPTAGKIDFSDLIPAYRVRYKSIALVALVPPAMILLMGVAIAWIIAGFRQRPRQQGSQSPVE